ncbi:hypothetical protein CPB83DRAFT_852916 [Crepidotus variabilis]|uniref:RanBD1 domain-containing protein n=1 Tax=Crepidotus variabilis TaxID=179855 RepID=A0A9P6EIE5_9AGAR|nr:hypothetical protein CPB83DRAFT_852916 [Crepidotus variabilis]
MKRGAEKQLTKDGGEDDELDESSSGQGFKKASDTALATRTIKALPGRAGKSGPPKSIFAGFGQPTGSLFGSNINASGTETSPAPDGSFSPFGTGFGASTPSAPTTSSFTFTSPAASTASSGSGTFNSSPSTTNTSKAFASILSASANPFSPAPTSNGPSGPDLTSYYKNLRGLNTSFLSTVSSTIEKDPFTDLSGLLESYKALRLKVQKEQDEESDKQTVTSNMKETSDSKLTAAPSTPANLSSFGKLSTSATDSKPTTTSSFASFSSKDSPAPASSSTPSGGSSLFSSNSAQPASTNAFTKTTSSTFPFGAPSKIPVPTEKPSSFFGSTPAVSDASKSTPFGNTTASSSSNSTPFSFGAPPTPSSTNPFGNTNTNLFGSSPSSSLPFKIEPGKNAFGNPTSNDSEKKLPSAISFGTPSQFSKSPGVFFGFGSTPASTSTSLTPTPAPTSESQETTTTEGGDEGGSAAGGSESKEGTPGLLTPNPHDEEGAGEENEETTHAVKLKAYRMKKADEQGGSGWSELGMGVFRLKKHRETDARRVLLRNSTNGKINMNFKIYSGLKPSVAKKALTFIGHADGVSQTYCVRLPNETQANELKAALDREIEFVKAKEP